MAWALAVMFLLLGAITRGAWAGPTLEAVGDGRDLWVMQRDAQTQSFAVFHRLWTDPVTDLESVRRDSGRIAPGGLATSHGTLWVAYDTLMLQSFRREERAAANGAPAEVVYVPKVEASLPRGVTLVSLAATGSGPWALVRVHDPATLAAIDEQAAPPPSGEPQTEAPAGDNPATATDATGDAASASSPPTTSPTATTPTPSPAKPVERLLRLRGSQWHKVELPQDWPSEVSGEGDAVSHLITPPRHATTPLLLRQSPATQPADEDATGSLIIYHAAPATAADVPAESPANGPVSPRWLRQDYPGVTLGPEAPRPIIVSDQLVIGRVIGSPEQLRLSLDMLRQGKTLPLGELTLDVNATASPWTMVPSGQTAAVLAWLDNGKWTWSRLSLTGQVVTPPSPLTHATPNAMAKWSGQIILLAVLVAATLIMFVFWRRDGGHGKLALPKDLALAEFGARALAGLIDLAPCAVAVMFSYGLDWRGLMASWPGGPGGLTAIIPGAVAMGLFILHTTLSEMFTGRSLGKMLMGLRVTDLSGKPINIWMALARGLTKALDLVPPFPLLLLPLINPHRQRLGDLVARTVVVSAAPQEKKPDEDKDNGGFFGDE